MQTFRRICIKDWSITAKNGDFFQVKRGLEYLTSAPNEDNNVVVFSNYWVSTPADVFAGEVEFTRPN